MADAPLCPDGWYVAHAERVELGQTTDAMAYVEVRCGLFVTSNAALLRSVFLSWRGSLTRGAASITHGALTAMGALAILEDGVTLYGNAKDTQLRPFRVRVASVECDQEEAAGKWRTFVVEVAAL